jgi:hypothetical protein
MEITCDVLATVVVNDECPLLTRAPLDDERIPPNVVPSNGSGMDDAPPISWFTKSASHMLT